MKRIFKGLITVLCICTMLFSISGCVSTPNTDDAKSLSANSSYNIDEYEEENVKIDTDMGMSYSDKGTVRFERFGVDVVDFWEYGSDKSETIYFEGIEKESFENNSSYIELAFEYKDMVYFIKRTYDKKSKKFSLTLYRTTLNGKDITKISTITHNSLINEDEDFYLSEYGLADAYVQNNTLIFRMYYEDYSSYNELEFSYIYKIDLKTGISKLLFEDSNIWLVGVTYDNDYTYLYTDDSNKSRKEKKITIDNKTDKISAKEYKHGKGEYYVSYMYKDMMVCIDETSENIFMLSTNKEPKTIFSVKNSLTINNVYLLDDTLLIKCNSAICYTYNLETGKFKEQLIADKINNAIYKVGDKYICYIEDKKKVQSFYDYYDDSYLEYNKDLLCEYLYWSSVDDVLTNKNNAQKIKNQPVVNYFSYPYVEYEN